MPLFSGTGAAGPSHPTPTEGPALSRPASSPPIFPSTLTPPFSPTHGPHFPTTPHDNYPDTGGHGAKLAVQLQAAKLKAQIVDTVNQPAKHLGIRHIQDIFREKADRMYHWADNRDVPAENNLAERDLRPTVIARKTSFGSQSDAGAHTRGVLMSVLYSLKKRGSDVPSKLKDVLDELAKDIHQDPFPLLFPRDSPSP